VTPITFAHRGARADLPAVLHEIMLLVKRLDGINRFRFKSAIKPETESG
jgi:hypothetical protein